MFKRRDIPPALLLLLLIILVMLTLSQILVVHNGRYGHNVHNMRKLQLELRQMDVNLHALMTQNVPSIELNRRLLQNQINAHRFEEIMSQASQPDLDDIPTSRLGDDKKELQKQILEDGSKSSDKLNALQLNSSTSPKQIRTNSLQERYHKDNDLFSPGKDPYRSPAAPQKIHYCPSIPPHLLGRLNVDLYNSSSWDDVARENPAVSFGGTWSPADCVARHRVAVIIPYRDREQHLITLLYYLHPILQRQQLDYRLYVVEQLGKDTFNKARIMNIGFLEALKQHHFQCFVFHDVDLVPEDDTNMYSCPLQPRHMSVAIDEMSYKLAYQELVGGVLNMRTEHFQRVNGYSNLYWGWGAEDDDMAYRAKLLYTGTRRFQFDGLNSLQYKVVHLVNKPLYTHVLVDIGRPPRGF